MWKIINEGLKILHTCKCNMDFAYVTFVNNNYLYKELMKSTILSNQYFSKYPIIVYCVDIPEHDNPFIQSDKCIVRNIRNIDVCHIFNYKPYVIIDAIKNGLKSGYYIESDDLLTPNSDTIIKNLALLDKYPISPRHPNNVDISTDFMNNLGVASKTMAYIHAHVLFKNTNIDFLTEWFNNCLKSFGECWDESALNCTYWKHGLTNHYLDVIDPYYTVFFENEGIINSIITLHGCKDPRIHSSILDRMIEITKSNTV